MPPKDCLIGIDAGTSVVKAVAFDRSGREICLHECPMPLRRLHPLWVEQDMPTLWKCVKSAVASVARQLRKRNLGVAGVGLTSTGDGTFLMTRAGRPVRAGLLWCDGRAGGIVDRMHRDGTADKAFRICGTSLFTGSQPVQLAWLRENEPESLHRAEVIFHAKDWLFYNFTGLITTDETDASLVMLDMATRRYDPGLFALFGLADQRQKYPAVRPSGENVASILPRLAAELGLPPATLVGSGPMDVAACALGSGAIEHGQASTILGTAGIHQVIMNRPILEPHRVGMTLCHGVKGRWLRMMAAMTATPNLEWFLRELAPDLARNVKGTGLYRRLDREIARIPVGANGVMFHPYLFPGGERGPFVKPTARASFTGLSLHHMRSHLLRAVYEGVALATLDCYEHMPLVPRSITLSGGGANSPVWCQIISDCLGKPVQVPAGSQFGAKGAAINVGVAAGYYKSVRDGVRQSVRMSRHYRPNRRNTQVYAQLYDIYRETSRRQMDLWDARSRILS